MRFHLQSFLKSEDQEELHRFRIQVKKISAFLMLMDHVNHDGKHIKCFKPVKEVFRRSGKLRNSYIARKLKPDSLPANKSAGSFRKLVYRRWKKIKKANLAIRRKIKGVKPAPLQRFYRSELLQVALSLKQLRSDDQLHDCRKRIKGFLYNYKLFKEVLDMALNTRYLEQVEEAIGKWHDQLLVNPPNTLDQTEEDPTGKLKSRITRLIRNFYQRALYMG